jgi:pyrimidine deaminase RibD-like protein
MAAIEESRRSPPSDTAYSVGAIVIGVSGRELARGHSRETHPHDHAEEVALARLAPRARVEAGPLTMYTSLEPCTQRRSRLVPCTDLIIAASVTRVVLAAREPELFADCRGVETLQDAGVEVVELEDLAGLVRAANAHLEAWRHPSPR